VKENAPRVSDDRPNQYYQQPIIHGDVEKGFAEADVVVEHNYSTQRIEHSYMENDTGVAYISENGQLVVVSGTQNIHIHRTMLADALGLPKEQVCVVQPPMGGAFGSKNDITVGGILAFVAWKLKRPVKHEYTREETFNATSKRHPYHMKAKIGAKKDGTLTAYDIEILADGGAYQTFSSSVVSRGIIHASGPYRFPNAKIIGKAGYSNTVFSSAMRGYGVPQTIFAVETIMDELAAKLKIDPLEIRAKNGYVNGDETVCGQVLDDNFAFQKCFETIRPHYERALKEARENQTEKVKRGVGVASAWFGPGRSAPDIAEVWAELMPDDILKISVGACDMGQGSDTAFWQIAAQTMGFPLERVIMSTTDTNITPDGNFSAGSRQCHVTGRIVLMATEQLKKAMEENGVTTYEQMKAKNIPTIYKVTHQQKSTKPDPQTGQCVPYETYSFGVQMAEVEVDVKTGKTKVLKITAVYDPGVTINRLTVETQIEGAIVQGMGYALTEEFIPGETDNFAKFRIPRAKDTPDMEVILIGVPRKTGPFGASGTGEYGLVPTAPAICNAIYNACGIRIRDLPASAEKVKAKL
jgi:aldehyde oxidoreductase